MLFGAEEDYIGVDPNLPGKPTSIWIDTTPKTNYKSLEEGLEVDVVVVGGGIAGITAAFLLKEAGKKVALIESRRIADDVTGHTTAKVTAQHGLIYKYLINNFGLENAKLYAKANLSAIKLIEVIIKENSINADFERRPAYIFSEYPAYVEDVRDEVEAAKKVGLNAEFVTEAGLPFPIEGALKVEDQAEFHPRKYLLALAKEIEGGGSYVFEETRALDIKEDNPCEVVTDKGSIHAKDIIIASHFPFWDKGRYYTKLEPTRSYVLTARIEDDIPEGIYYSVEKDDYHAIRSQLTPTGRVLIVNGNEHKAGQGDEERHYEDLERYLRDHFKVKSIEYHWSTQDNFTTDRVPYIGLSPKSTSVYLATGFNGWGMTLGTVSAIIITEEILGKKNPWVQMFEPNREKPIKAFGKLFTQNVNVAEQYAKKSFGKESFEFVADMPEGMGKVVEYGGKKVASFRDEKGNVHTLSSTCTHLGCQVNWNNAEKTWDCPCHGSRYSAEGDVIHGPALYSLKPEEEEEKKS